MMQPQTAKPKLPPGPEKNVLFSSKNELLNDVLGLLQRNVNQYPGISRMRIGPYYFVNVSEPELIEKVLTDSTTYIKGRENNKMKYLLGNGLLTNDGKFWLKQRRLIQPLFHKKRLESFVTKIADCTNLLIKKWEASTGEVIDVHGEMTHVTLSIVSQTLMSTDAGGEFKKVSDALEVLMKGLSMRSAKLLRLPYWVPTPDNLKMKRNREVLNTTIYNIIYERRKQQQAFDDLLSMLLEVEDADSAERMTDEQVRDEALTIFLAGHETTANAMSFAFYLLAKHPEAAARVKQEAEQIMQNGGLTFENLNRLEYTTRVIKEAMRLYPPAWGILREAAHDVQLGDYLVKKGDSIVLAPYAVHRLEQLWPEPEKFDPDRFLPERMKTMHRYAYFPFGGGARLCIGNNFAMMEMQIMLSLIASKFSFAVPADFNLKLDPLITLRPKGKLNLLLNAAD